MELGAVTSYIDVAQLAFLAFLVFFGILIFNLQREARREGYPVESDEDGRLENTGPFYMPDPKTYRLPHGHGEVSVPNAKRETRGLKLRPLEKWGGAPKVPTGNPMTDGVGPASYAERADVPDLTADGKPKIVPLSVAHGFSLSERDPNPIGMEVMGCDRKIAGTITEAWVDQSESILRYYEVALPALPEQMPRTVLLPVNFCVIRDKYMSSYVYVHAITAAQFADVPALRNPQQVTFLEEDKICGYYGGGLLYATPQRQESYL